MKTNGRFLNFSVLGICLLLTFASSCKKDDDNSNQVKDIDGNVYHTVTIGTQVWMVENLKTTRYNDNTSIPLITDSTVWFNLTTPGYCWYSNDAVTYKNLSGALYNWYSINTGKLAPIGWRIPTDDDWTVLTTFLGGDSVAGGKLKETGTKNWQNPNISASNETGFTAIPGGYRSADGYFSKNKEFGYWWSSSEIMHSEYIWTRGIYNDYSNVFRGDVSKKVGFSIRCVRNI